jgi:hypothetical protein
MWYSARELEKGVRQLVLQNRAEWNASTLTFLCGSNGRNWWWRRVHAFRANRERKGVRELVRTWIMYCT